jgi:hypothetical protein
VAGNIVCGKIEHGNIKVGYQLNEFNIKKSYFVKKYLKYWRTFIKLSSLLMFLMPSRDKSFKVPVLHFNGTAFDVTASSRRILLENNIALKMQKNRQAMLYKEELMKKVHSFPMHFSFFIIIEFVLLTNLLFLLS